MENGHLGWITNFIWGIADDVLRDVYVRGKYRDVILPMMVLRRLDAILEPTKQAVIDMRNCLDDREIVHQDVALRQAAGQAFYNHVDIHIARSQGSRQTAAVARRFRGVPGRASPRTCRKFSITSRFGIRFRGSSNPTHSAP